MIRYIPVAGTHAVKRGWDWDDPNSAFNEFLKDHGIVLLMISPLKRYAWSTALDGLDATNETWDAAGRALAHYIAPPLLDTALIPQEELYVIAHSHGGNVVAYACGKYGLKINGLITVGTPIRKDLEEIYEAASHNIKRHLHLHAGWRDYMQALGALFDGRWGIHRKHPFAKNAKMPKGHGDILRDPTLFHNWLDKGWLDYFMGKCDER